MDTPVLVAIVGVIGTTVGVIGTIAVEVIKTRIRERKPESDGREKYPERSYGPTADIVGTWVSKSNGEYDEIEITREDAGQVSGKRRFAGTDGVPRDYLITGYYDGMLLALGATGKEGRTLSIVMKRRSGNKLSGIRTYFSPRNDAFFTKEREWLRSKS